MVTDNVEFGGGISIGYNSNTSTQSQSTTVYTMLGLVDGTQQTTNKNTTLNTGINPFVAYHFPIKGRFDIYLGVSVGANISFNKNGQINETLAANYSDKNETKQKQPLGFGVNGGLFVGCRYFFYKNIAIGAQAGLGAGGVFTKGKSITETTYTSTGSANWNNGYSSTDKSEYKVDNRSVRLNGMYAGITLSFYVSPKKQETVPANVN